MATQPALRDPSTGPGREGPETRRGLRRLRRARGPVEVSWWFLVPGLAIYGLVLVYPSIQGVGFAFTDWSGLASDFEFTGLANFRTFLADPQAYSALSNTIIIALGITVIQNAVGLAIALAVHSNLKARAILRVLFVLPTTVATVIVAVLWSYLYTSRGPINLALGSVGLDEFTRSWVGDPSTVLGAIVLVVVWQFAGYSMVIFLAGLESIPGELQEAASLDGAGAFSRFLHVTLPLIAPALTINLMLSLIGGLKLFDQIFVMTGGGPGYASETLSTALYKQAFQSGRFGYGTAIALVLTVFVTFAALLQLFVLRRHGEHN